MAKDRAHDPKRKVHPAGILITNTTGIPQAHTERLVAPRPGQKKASMNYKVVKEPYTGPVSGSDVAKANHESKMLDKMFGFN